MENTYYTDIQAQAATEGWAALVEAENAAYEVRKARWEAMTDDEFDAEMEALEFEHTQRHDHDAYVNGRF